MAASPQKTPQLSIIIINYQTDQLVLDLLSQLGMSPELEVIIVDNSSKNTLQAHLGKSFPEAKYYFTGKNLGFAGGNNYGIKLARGEWILLLNSDTSTNLRDLRQFLSLTKTSGYFVAAPRLVNENGIVENNVGYFDGLSNHPLNWLLARPRFIDCQSQTSSIPVDLLTGAAMLIHRSIFKRVGMMDASRFFMYFEDIDFSFRLHQAGVKILYVPDVTIVHFQGASSNQNRFQKHINYLHGLDTYLVKHRGALVKLLNHHLKLFY